ncbi:MAG: hypothetical protein Q7V17_09315 [Afipia sp.]|nr:hypothetical protein [Afipia sp.]
MTRLVAMAMVSAAMASAALAQQLDPKVLRQRPHAAPSYDTAKTKPLARSRPSASCAEFGPGFVRMPGSDSCMRFGGGVGIGVGAVP